MPPAVERAFFTIGAIYDFERLEQRLKIAGEIGSCCPFAVAGHKHILFAFALNDLIKGFAFEIRIELQLAL